MMVHRLVGLFSLPKVFIFISTELKRFWVNKLNEAFKIVQVA